jgi:hypothetical protein
VDSGGKTSVLLIWWQSWLWLKDVWLDICALCFAFIAKSIDLFITIWIVYNSEAYKLIPTWMLIPCMNLITIGLLTVVRFLHYNHTWVFIVISHFQKESCPFVFSSNFHPSKSCDQFPKPIQCMSVFLVCHISKRIHVHLFFLFFFSINVIISRPREWMWWLFFLLLY